MVRKRVWVYSQGLNYTDRMRTEIKDSDLFENNQKSHLVVFEEENTHWNYGDFVNASCISLAPMNSLNKLPNYMVLYGDGQIESHWFVMNTQFISGEVVDAAKYQVQLKRDVIIDYKTQIANGIVKVERGNLSRTDYSPILVQPEGLTLNQVKVGQKDIKSWDNDTMWLTVFFDITSGQAETINFPINQNFDADFLLNAMSLDYTNQGGFSVNSTNMYYRAWSSLTRRYRVNYTQLDWSGFGTKNHWLDYEIIVTPNGLSYRFLGDSGGTLGEKEGAIASVNSHLSKLGLGSVGNTISSSININKVNQYTFLRNKYDGRLIDIGAAVIKRASINLSSGTNSQATGITTYTNALDAQMATLGSWKLVGQVIGADTYVTGNSAIDYHISTLNSYQESFTTSVESVVNGASVTLPIYSQLDELNIGCISIPYGADITLQNGSSSYQLAETTIKSLFTYGWTNTGTRILDIQILPYCPVGLLNTQMVNSAPTNTVNITNLPEDYKIPITMQGATTPLYYALTCRQSSMDYRYQLDLSDFFTSDLKKDSISKFIRLKSHNHKSAFEFKPTLNNGVNQLSFECTLRPYNTIYRISPVFNNNGLYGGNFKDDRGLIWEGGTSLSQVTSEWVQYKLQNSTYQSVFDREVTNLENTQGNTRLQETLGMNTAYGNAQNSIRIAKNQQALSAAMGAIGVASGIATKGPLAVLGGIGMIGSSVSSGINIQGQQETAERNLESSKSSQRISDAQRAEDLSYKQDIWNLNMTAIAARPGTLALNTDYSSINNKKAYIEFYDCTQAEKNFIEDYIIFKGMKIGLIDGLAKYTSNDSLNYIEGTVYRLNGLTPTIANAINSELSTGIYVQKDLF